MNIIIAICVTIVITLGTPIICPNLVPTILILGLIVLICLLIPLIFLCHQFGISYKNYRKYSRSMHNHLQDCIINRDEIINSLRKSYEIKTATNNYNTEQMLNLISQLIDEVEEGKDMIKDLIAKK